LRLSAPNTHRCFSAAGADTTRAVDALKDAAAGRGTPFLLIIGSSGSGKSSLARAGLSPRLTTPGVVGAVDVWRVAMMRPGERKGQPVLALAQRLFDGAKDIPPDEEGRPPALPELAKSSHNTPQRLAAALAGGDAASVAWALDAIAEQVKDLASSPSETPTDADGKNGERTTQSELRVLAQNH